MKKILFPFETNQPIYKEAYVYAVKFARNLGAELIMLNVFEIESDYSLTPKEYKNIIRDNWFKAYQEIIKFNKHFLMNYARIESELKIKVDYRFLHGNLINEISKIISAEEIDLIVLSEANQTEPYKEIVKVVWQDVYAKDPVALLLIPGECIYHPIKSTAFVAEMDELGHVVQHINTALKYAKVFDTSVHFLHVSQSKKDQLPGGRDDLNDMIQTIERSSKHVFKNLIGRDIIGMIEEYTEKNNVQLMFVVRHHHYFFESLFHKNLSDEICLKSNIPVLVMKEKED